VSTIGSRKLLRRRAYRLPRRKSTTHAVLSRILRSIVADAPLSEGHGPRPRRFELNGQGGKKRKRKSQQQSYACEEDLRKPLDFPEDSLVEQIETGREGKPGIAQLIERQFLQDLPTNIRHRGNPHSLESQPRERFPKLRSGGILAQGDRICSQLQDQFFQIGLSH
jgi:hypothetical protein